MAYYSLPLDQSVFLGVSALNSYRFKVRNNTSPSDIYFVSVLEVVIVILVFFKSFPSVSSYSM